MTYKIQISKPGYNVLTETDPNNLIFSSDFNTLKYFVSFSISLHVIAYASEYEYLSRTSVYHGLGYYPFFSTYVKDNLMTNYQPTGRFQAGSGAVRSFHSYVDSNYVYFVAFGNASSSGEDYYADFKCDIFKNNLGL